jgi:hypothetical protein
MFRAYIICMAGQDSSHIAALFEEGIPCDGRSYSDASSCPKRYANIKDRSRLRLGRISGHGA